MASNDALLLEALMGPNAEQDGTDPLCFFRRPEPAPAVQAVISSSAQSVSPHAARPRRAEFISASDLSAGYYTIGLAGVTGVHPMMTRTAAAAAPTGGAGSVGSLIVTFQLFHLSEAITPVVQSSLSSASDTHTATTTTATAVNASGQWATHRECFDELVALPVTVAELPLDCEVRCVVYTTARGPVAHAAFHPFSLAGGLRGGYTRVGLSWGTASDSCGGGGGSTLAEPEWELHAGALHRGLLPAVPWMDRVTGERIRTLREASEKGHNAGDGSTGDSSPSPSSIPSSLPFLSLQLPVPIRAVPVLRLSDAVEALTAGPGVAGPTTLAAALRPAAYHPTAVLPYVDHYRLARDHSACEAAAAVTARSMLLQYDAAATPGPRERRLLSRLAELPPLQLQPPRLETVALLWQYRNFIARDPRLFIPFMRTVDWRSAGGRTASSDGANNTNPSATSQRQRQLSAECRAARELIPRWKPLALPEVLGCLAGAFAGAGPVRAHAVRLLARESDGSLCWLAPQLIQALRHDTPPPPRSPSSSLSLSSHPNGDGRELHDFLLRRAVGHWELCCALYWGAAVEAHIGPAACPPIEAFRQALAGALAAARPLFLLRLRRQLALRSCLRTIDKALASVPGDRTSRIAFGQRLLAKQAGGFASLFHSRQQHQQHQHASSSSSTEGGSSSNRFKDAGPQSRVDTPTAAAAAMAAGPVSPLAAPTALDRSGAVALPTHPAVSVDGVEPKSFYVFKSAKQPMQVGFRVAGAGAGAVGDSRTNSNSSSPADALPADAVFVPLALDKSSTAPLPPPPAEVRLIYKADDDVRLDQLVLQLLHWVDALLRLDGLDLYLTPYRVLATGPMEGLVEVVPDVVTFFSVQRDVLRHLRVHNPSAEGLRLAMDRYTRSLAGYSVFTFMLGIGDRHLENILLTRDGRLLHIDFGYILGHDPKPFPPPMKISREMLEVLGGPESPGYAEFKTYCCLAYNTLRKHAPLLLNLMQLMCHAEGMPQLTCVTGEGGGGTTATAAAAPGTASDPAAPVPADPRLSLLKVQEKLRLDLSDAQATQYIQKVIADSVGSIFTGLWDVIHAAAQATRA